MSAFDAVSLIDDELAYVTMLTRDLPDVAVSAELDVTSYDDIPVLTVYVGSGGQDRNGPGLWSSWLSLNVFDHDADRGWSVCTRAYDAVHKWSDPDGLQFEGIRVIRVSDSSMFTRTPLGQMQSKDITQWVGTFDITLRTIAAPPGVATTTR